MHIKEVEDHKRNILAQLAMCKLKLDQSGNPIWIASQIALEQVLATIDQTLVLEHGFSKLWEVMKTDLINDTLKTLEGE